MWLNVAGEVLAMRAAEVLPSDEIGRRGLFRSENVVMRIVRRQTGRCKLIISKKKKKDQNLLVYIYVYILFLFLLLFGIFTWGPPLPWCRDGRRI